MWKSERTIAREVDDEIEFHIAMAAAERERAGRDPYEARVGAERAFGDRPAIRRACVREAVGPRRYLLAVAAAGALALVGTVVVGVADLMLSDPWSRISPFTRVDYTASAVEVRLPDGGEYELVAIDGIAVDTILEHCNATYGRLCEKRFAEDLVEVLESMGHAPGDAADLRLRDRTTGAEIARQQEPMTAANRRAIREARREGV